MKTIFSGIQPTGVIHLGNYLGAIKNWKDVISRQQNSQFLFSIVDLHAITIYQNPDELRQSILNTFALYVACDIFGDNITVFQQSMVSQHVELAWVLSCNLQMGFLDRMTQYKEKTTNNKERACLGLYSYPVLMAADILLYKTDLVPVGEDQIQHIELTRDIAQKFNQKYKNDIFTLPNYILTEAKRVMSLKDGSKKMSKSDESDLSRINLLDDIDTIAKKIQKAKTGDLEIQNLSTIYETISKTKPSIESMSVFKKDLTDVIISELLPIQEKYKKLIDDKNFLYSQMNIGAEKARNIANKNLKKIYKIIGLN